MAFQPCPGIAELVLSITGPDGDVAENVLHVSNGGTAEWTTADLQTLVNGIDTWCTTPGGSVTSLVDNMCGAYTISGISARDLTIQAGAEYNKTVTHAGAVSSPQTASGLTKSFTLRSGLAGRSQRGRIFFIGLCEAAVSTSDPNQMASATIASLITTYGSLIAYIAALHSGWVWVVLSRRTNGGLRADGVGTAINAVGVSNDYLDYQRRRAPFHGRHH